MYSKIIQKCHRDEKCPLKMSSKLGTYLQLALKIASMVLNDQVKSNSGGPFFITHTRASFNCKYIRVQDLKVIP